MFFSTHIKFPLVFTNSSSCYNTIYQIGRDLFSRKKSTYCLYFQVHFEFRRRLTSLTFFQTLSTKGAIIFFIEGRSASRHKCMEVLYLAGALMEHFLEGSAPLRLWKLTQKRIFIFVTLLIWVSVPKVLTE